MSKQWAAEDVLRQSQEWVSPWYPPTARHVVVDDFEFYVQDADATLMTHRAVRPDRSCIGDAIRAASRSGAETLSITFGAEQTGVEPNISDIDTFGDVEHVGTTDVLALNLDGFNPAGVPVPAVIRVDAVGTPEQFAEYERTSACAWGYPEPTDEAIRAGFEKLTSGWFVAYREGTPIGTGGYSLVGAVARLWGAAVLPSARGQGAYRGLVVARLNDAANRGATLALTHAAPTSSPILRRLGFEKYGEQRTFRFNVKPPAPVR